MGRRFYPRSTARENLQAVVAAIPWKLLLLLPVLLVLAIPAYLLGARMGRSALSSLTQLVYTASGPQVTVTPTPVPSFPTRLPQVGSLLYTVQNGDSCDSILALQMHSADAGSIFTDARPETVRALDAALGQDCHALQPGMVLTLSPQYPLIALGGVVLKIDAATPQQVVPTPLIAVPTQELAPDCSGGCSLLVRIASQVQIHLVVQTTLAIQVGSWVWAQAALARKHVANFDAYPYADLTASLNGMTLRACDFQVNNTHDGNSLSCDQLLPNTIDDDGGSWMFAVTGPGALDHWHYAIHQPAGTQILFWLSAQNGNLIFKSGNPLYRYNSSSHLYVKI